jgi:hypothetical protein
MEMEEQVEYKDIVLANDIKGDDDDIRDTRELIDEDDGDA